MQSALRLPTCGDLRDDRHKMIKDQRAYRTVRLHRSGNSLGLYVPRVVAAQLCVQPGDEMRLYVVGQVMCVEAVGPADWNPSVVAAEKQAPTSKGEPR